MILGNMPGAPTWLQAWGAAGVLRMLAAPLLATGFLLCACFAPARFSRWTLLGATVCEGAVAGFAVFNWLVAPRLH
jgi:hypothetical protein